MNVEDVWEREKGFWLDGPGFYGDRMVPGAQMVFPDPVGILKGDDILAGLKGAPRWDAVEMEETTELEIGDTLVLAYRATGTREGSTPYVALCSSAYVFQEHMWKLTSHQQTPVA